MNATKTGIDERSYTALHEGAALQMRPGHGLLALSGADRVDFIQRMTTNNIAALAPGQAAVTVLTSPVARVKHVFTVLQRGDDLWLLPAGEEGEDLVRDLRSQIFFMDKVTVENASESFRRMRLMGPTAADVLAQASLPVPGEEQFVQQDGVCVLHQPRFDLPGYELIVPSAEIEAVQERLLAAGALLLTDEGAYRTRRVELGRPGPAHELTEEYNPLEVGLGWTCAENKGCYTGQEIIARQVSYDKITKSLVGLRSDEPLHEGSKVEAEGRSVGAVTSSAYSPALAAPVALAVLRRPHHESGRVVEVDGQPATVVELPFVSG